MPKFRIFIGSSTAARRQATVFANHFESGTVEFVRWWEAFTPGRTLLNELDRLKSTVDAAILLMTPEIPGEVRGSATILMNQNVLFEFGYFYGHLGADKTALIPFGTSYIPTDLSGYTHITGSKFFQPGKSTTISQRIEKSFNKWVESA